MTTPNERIWGYRDDSHDATRDLVGYDVEAIDGSVGKIDEATVNTSRSYLVADTGFWIFGKKRLIPAGVIDRVDHDDHKVYLSMTKQQIKDAPDLDDEHQVAEHDDEFYEAIGAYYGGFGNAPSGRTNG
jgi:hypothetical protein